ncbi:MAG: GTP cyclohydrolase I, partial [Ktedonobacterales bacterium]
MAADNLEMEYREQLEELDERDLERALRVHPRHITDEQLHRFEGYISEIFGAFGLDLHTPATERTPQRFIRALYDVTDGYEGDAKVLTIFGTECRGDPDCQLSQVSEGPIQFYSLCEHHGLPIIGRAYVGYIAHEHIIGISKLTRLVRLFARRFTVQERLGQQIAEALETILAPHGVAVYL